MVESNKLSREFLAERDLRIFNLKKSGLSNVDIGKRFNMSAAAVAAASRRVLGRLNSEAFLSYPEVLRLELERLDEMQKSLWPLTQFRRETLDDGSEIMVEPDQNAVRTVLGIMDRRAKLLGMNVERTEVAISGLESHEVVEVQSSLVGQVKEVGNSDAARDESLALLELMASSGVLDQSVVSNILDNVSDDSVGTPLGNIEGNLEGADSPDIIIDQEVIIDAEIISEEIDEENE
tara:strand:+ start:700 stop:1404 length:705 start_codon:yes stop_codon:yes gene_type:complete